MGVPNPAFTIRPANQSDIGRLCEFAEDYLLKMHAQGTGKEARQVFQHVLKHSDTGIIIVAEQKAAVCAYAYALYQWRSEFGGETMEMVELFVEQAWRNRGVAASLIAFLVD